jgi:hypothetical protein
MRSPALAIVWSVWSRSRTGFIVSTATLAALAIVYPLLAAVTPAVAISVSSTVPLVVVFAFMLNALLVVEDHGSLSSRFPRHMLTLPVRTRTLAFWPILFASSTAPLFWVAAAHLIYRPAGYQLPVLIPALGLAALMAWAQALAWLPITNFVLREVTNIALVAALGALPIWLTFTGRGSGGLITTIFVLYLVSAGVLGWAAITSDRRGQTWRFWPERSPFEWIATPLALARNNRPFRSPFAAQVWYEWNCHGLMLNGLVGLMLFSVWTVLLATGRHGSPQWFAMIVGILVIGVVAAIAATGVSFGRFRPIWSHSRVFVIADTFMATRPMSTSRLVAAKFRMSAASVLWNWALAVTGTTVWIVVSGNLDNAAIVARDLFNRYPSGRGVTIIALACILLQALSWRLLTGALAPVLTGRRWVADGAVWSYLAFLAGLGCCAHWVARSPEHLAWFYSVLPWLVAGVGTVKGTVAVAAFRAARRQELMSWQIIVGLLSLWLLLTGCGIAMAVLVGPTSAVPLSWPVIALGVATLVPLVRFPLATLALDWNRHR